MATRYLHFLLPSRIARGIELYDARNAAVGYDTSAVMEELDTDKIYLGELLCLSPELRGCGIGTALVMQSLHEAVKAGCEHYFSALTTPRSQRIFGKLGFQTLKSLDYGDFRDAEGKRYIDDVEEGSACMTVHKAL